MDKWIRFKNKRGNIILERFTSFVRHDKMLEINGQEIQASDATNFENAILSFIIGTERYLNLAEN